MSVQDEPRAPSGGQGTETIHVAVESLTESKDFTVRRDCTVGQLKRGLSDRLGSSAEQLVLIHSGRVLGESEILSQLKGQRESVSICMVRRPPCSSAAPTGDLVSGETVRPEQADDLTPSPTSPLCLVEGLDSLPGLFPALQRKMEQQLLDDPEMTCRLLGGPLVQSTLSSSRPQITKQLLETNQEVGDVLNDTDIITQVLELIRNPDMMEEVLQNEDGANDGLKPKQEKQPQRISGDFGGLQTTEAETQEHGLKLSRTGRPSVVTISSGGDGNQKSYFSFNSTDPLGELAATPTADPSPQSTVTAGMKSLLDEITASPGLMEELLSGPYVGSLLNCLGQNPDLAAQMLLSHPLFTGNPQLQQQMRQQLPLFLQQMQSPELLSAMLNTRAMEALLQIQQGLQTLAAEVPTLVPAHSGNCPQVATVTEEQQQQFVQQMLQALANTNSVHREEAEFQEGTGATELDGLQ